MKRRAGRIARITLTALLLAVFPIPLGAQSLAGGDRHPAGDGKFDCGIIFNTSDILLSLESYQGGIGMKFGWGNIALRGTFDVLYNGSADAFNINGGIGLEYHLFKGPVSPYVGAIVSAGYMWQKDVSTEIPVTIGAIAGAEVFIFDFLSFFAEYCLAADLTWKTDEATGDDTFDYLIDTRMGNNSKLGIVIYLQRAGSKKRRAADKDSDT
jgi:hypothetical protein